MKNEGTTKPAVTKSNDPRSKNRKTLNQTTKPKNNFT